MLLTQDGLPQLGPAKGAAGDTAYKSLGVWQLHKFISTESKPAKHSLMSFIILQVLGTATKLFFKGKENMGKGRKEREKHCICHMFEKDMLVLECPEWLFSSFTSL